MSPVTRNFLALYPPLHFFMAYIPSHALAGLRNYKYKGVDKCDPSFIPCERSLNIYSKILTIKLCIEPVLELVRHSLAGVDRAKYGTQPGSQLIYTSITVATCLADNAVRPGNGAA
jgi:hypothetical protein